MKTYLVTGGAGFIGSNLVDRLLADKNKVIAIDNFNDYYDPSIKERNIQSALKNDNFRLYRFDIRNQNDIKTVFDENKIDVVIHLAAMAGVRTSLEKPNLYNEVNIIGTQNILEEMKNHKVNKIVMASSSSVYGNCSDVPFKENMVVDFPISIYAATKKSNEVMTHVYHKLYNISVLMLRFFTVYGKRQRPDLAISKFVKMLLNDEEITMYGDGTSFRDYTYIDDIIDGIIKSIDYVEKENNVYEILNLGNSKTVTLKEMITTIGNTLNINPKIKQMDIQQGDVNGTCADITKAKKLIGYNPKLSFNEGIELFINWYKENN